MKQRVRDTGWTSHSVSMDVMSLETRKNPDMKIMQIVQCSMQLSFCFSHMWRWLSFGSSQTFAHLLHRGVFGLDPFLGGFHELQSLLDDFVFPTTLRLGLSNDRVPGTNPSLKNFNDSLEQRSVSRSAWFSSELSNLGLELLECLLIADSW